MEVETSRLMAAAKAGDDAAFEALVALLRGRAYHVAHGLVGSREDALDVLQEAFLKTFRARRSFRVGEPFLPWFHSILRNTCYSFLRKRRTATRRTAAVEEDDEPEWTPEGSLPPPSRRAEGGELHAAFWDAFGGLGARDREILALRHFQERSYREIAEALGIPEGTVMSRLFHARRHLRERLAPHLSGALDGLGLDGDGVGATRIEAGGSAGGGGKR